MLRFGLCIVQQLVIKKFPFRLVGVTPHSHSTHTHSESTIKVHMCVYKRCHVMTDMKYTEAGARSPQSPFEELNKHL